MENKSNSLSRIKRQQREKVLRFSIRKYSFGAASVAVAALMFLGARVASADSVLPNAPQSNTANTGVVNPKDKVDSPVDVAESTENKVDAENQALTNTAPSASTVDKAKLKKVVEELNALLSTKLNLDESVVSPVKDRLQKGKEALENSDLAQKDIDELVELLSKDVTVVSAAKETTGAQVDKTEKPADNLASQSSPEERASEEEQTVSAKKDALKVSVDQLKAAVLELPEHETSKEVLEKANEVMVLAQGVLENTTVSLNDVEQMNKLVKRMFNSVKNATTRLASGARDSRNGKSMGQGTGFRATTTDDGRVEDALINVKEYISEPKGGSTVIGNRDRTITKTFIRAKYSEENGAKFITYDVYFQNDGRALDGLTRNALWFYPPRDILYPSNNYPVGTLNDAYYERYRNNTGTGTLSHNPNNFTKVGDTYRIPLNRLSGNGYQDDSSQRLWGEGYSLYQMGAGPSRDNQRQEMLKHLAGNQELDSIIKSNGKYPGASYSHLLSISSGVNYAYKYHVKMRLKDNVTADEAKRAGVMAVTTKAGLASNASAAYVYAALGSRLVTKPDAQVYPIKGSSHTKTVGDTLLNPENPVAAGYITLKNGGEFPSGMNWGWKNNNRPSTATAGVFNYTATARYQDGSTSEDVNSGSDGSVRFTVKPKTPTITTDVAHKKGLTNQQITVNVGSGVPNGSTVKLYDGNTVIGTGTTNGETATVTVTGALPGNPITAETVVNNGGTVTSVRSNPVTPTPKPDTQPPTLDVTPAEQTVKVGEKIEFKVNGQDDTKVNLDFSDIFTKYPNHLFTQKTNYSVNTDKQKTLSIDLGEAKETDIGEKTITFKASDDANPEIVKTVKVKVIPATKENEKHNPTAETVVVGIKQELTDEAIKAKVKNYPSNATLSVKQKPDTDTTGNKTATVVVTYSDKSTDEVTVPVVVRDTTPPKIYWAKDDGSKVELGKTHAEGQNIVIPLYRGDAVNTRLITTDDSGKVTNFKTENLQSGFNFTPVSGTATEGSPLGQNVTGTVGLGVAKGKYTARAISTDGTNTTTGHFVFEVHEQAEKYTPAANTLTVPFNHKITDDEVKGKVIAKPGTPAFPDGTIFEVVSKPETNTTGTDKKAVVKITYPDKSTENIDVPVHVGRDSASQHPLEGKTVTVTVGDSLRNWKGNVDGNYYTDAGPNGKGNGVEWGWKGTAPKVLQDTAGVFKYTVTATHPDKSVAESNPKVTVIVKPKAPTIETDLTGKAELPNTAVVVNVHDGVKDGSTVTLYSQDGRAIGTGTVANGKATVTGTIPKGNITAKTTVQTPGEQDVTSDPSPEKVATTNKAALYPIKGKTVTVTVGDSLRNWKGNVDGNYYTDAGPNGKGNGVEWGWEGTAPKVLQDTAGVFKYTATATHTDKTVAKSDPQVTIIVKPKAPTIETDLTGKSNQENVPVTVSVGGGVKDGSIVTLYGPDGTTVIGTGTVTNGKATAIITGKVPVGNITAKTTVQTPGQDDVVSEPSPIKEATNIVPTAKTQTVGLNEQPNAKNSIGNNGDLPNGTNYTWKTTPDTSTPGDKPGVVTVTYPDGSTIDVPVTVKVTQVSDDYAPKYEDGSGKPGSKVEIPLKEENGKDIPVNTTYVSDQPGVIDVDDKGKVTVTIPKDKNPGDEVTGKVLVRYPDGSEEEVPVKVTVTNRDKDDYAPKYEDGSGKPGSKVEIPLKEENGKDIPVNTTYVSDQPGVIDVDDKGKVTVTIPKDKNPGEEVTGKVLVRYPDGSEEEVPVKVTVTNRDKDDYTPKYNDGSGKPGSSVEIPVGEANGKKIPDGTTYTSGTPGITIDKDGKVTVTIPGDKNPGEEVTGKVLVRYPDGSEEEVPVKVTVTNRDKDDYTPKYNDGSGKPGSKVEIPVTEENGKKIPDGTTFGSDKPGVIDVDKDGKVTVTIPEGSKPGDKITGKITVTYPDGSKEEVPVSVTVTNQDKDDYTPKYKDGNGKPGSKVEIPVTEENGKKIPDGTTFGSDKPGVIDVDKDGKVTVTIPEGSKPGDKITGKITVTYPDGSKEEVPVSVTVTNQDKDDYTPKYKDGNGKPGSKVEIPVTEENGKKIPDGTTFGSDKPGVIDVDKDGKVTVTIPEGSKPGDKITGKITVTYPDGSKEEVPVSVTVTNQDKDDYTPKYKDGNGKPGSKVEIPVTEENGKKIPDGTTFGSDKPGVIDVDKDGKVTVTIPEGSKPGDKITGKITVTYPDGSKEEVPVSVTVTNQDKDDYTPKYKDGNGKPGSKVEIPVTEENGKKIPDGTTFGSDKPGVIDVDKDGKVTVTIPEGSKPGDKITGKITVTYPDGSKEEVPVSVTVTNQDKDDYTPKYKDGNGKPGSKVEIPVTEENGKKIPDGTTFGSDKPGVIDVDKDGKVTVTIPEGSKPGDKITGKITVTYPDGSEEEVPVKVTVTNRDKDDYTPKYNDGSGKPGSKVEIPVTEENGKKIPDGTTFGSDKPGVIDVDKDGKVTVTIPEGSKPGDKITGKITVTYPDGSKEEVPVSVTVTNQDKDDYTPKYKDGNGKPGSKVEIPVTEENGKKIPDGTTFGSDKPGVIDVDKDGKVTVTIPEGSKPGDKITGKITVTYPDGSEEEVPVKVTVTNRDKDDYTPKYNDGSGKPGSKVEIPVTEENGKKIPDGTTFGSDKPGVIDVDKDGKVTVTIPEGSKPGDKITGKITVTYPDGSKEEVPVSVTVTNQDKDDYTPKYKDGNGKPGSKVEIPVTEENGKKIPDGTTFGSDKPGVIDVDKDGKVTVTIPEGSKPGDKITGKITVTYPDGSKEEVPVSVTVTNQDKDDYTPKYKDGNGKPGSKVEIPVTEENGKKIPDGTTFGSDKPGVIDVDKDGKVTVTIPEGSKPGDKITGKITVTYPDGSKEEVPVSVTVTNQDKDDYTPKYKDGNGKPGSKVEIPVTEENGKKIPDGTTFGSDKPGVIDVDKDGKVTVTIPEGSKPGDKITGKITVTYPDGSKEEVPVSVTVTNQDKDDYTPKYKDGNGKPGSKVEIPVTEENGKKIPDGTTFGSDKPGVIDVDKDGKVTVTIPEGSKPGDKITGKITVTYPDGSKEEVPVSVTVTNQDKDDYTPKYKDGNGKPGSKVEIPVTEENGKKIPDGTTFGSDKPGVIDVDKDGKVTVTIPEGSKPGDKITGKITVTYPDGSKEEVPVSVTVTNQDKDDYTPKYKDGNGKPGSKVEIPVTEENGKKIPDGTTFGSDKPGVIDVDKDGKVTVTIPEGSKPGDKITGKITVTYPDGSEEEVPVKVTVTNRDKDDYTPKYNDGSGKPGSKVEIPVTEENGKKIPDGTTFGSDKPGVIDVDKDGKVTVTIPEGSKPGDKITGKITVTYPDGSKEEVPVSVTVTNQDKDDYTPKYKDGNGKPGSKVEIPVTEENGKKIPDGTTFGSDKPGVIDVDKDGKVTVTIPEGSKPGDKITGKITVTYPDGSEEEVPVKVTVTNRDKDDYTPKYNDGSGKPGSKVEIPVTEENGKKIPDGTTFGSDKPGVIDVDKDGKVTVTIPEGSKPGDKITGKITVTYPDGSKEEVPVSVTVTNQDKDDYTPKYKDGNGKPGSKVEIPVTEENGKKIPDGTTFGSDKPGVIDVDKDGKVTVTIPEGSKPGDKITGKITVTYPDGSKEEVPVSVTVTNQDKDDYTPKYKDGNGKPGSKVEIPVTEENGKKIPDGTTFGSDKPGVIDVDKDGKVTVTIPEGSKPGDKITGKITVTYPDGSKEEVPVSVTVTNQDKDDYTPKYKDGNGKPGSKVEIPVTEENGKKIPDGTTFGSDKPGVIDVDKDGKVTVTIPEGSKPGDKITGKITVTYPDGSKEEVPVSVTVTNQDKDDYTPKYKDGNGKPGSKVEIPVTEENGKKIPDGTTFGSDKPGVIDVDKDGKVTVTIPEGSKPGDKITGKITVTYPDGSKEEVPVSVTVTNQDKDDYTPKYKDGNGKPGSKVEIPVTEENGKKIPDGTTFGSDKPGVIDVDKDGKVTVTIPEGSKPGDKITGKITVTYPDGSKEEVPVSVTVTNQDKDDYTPKYKDGNGKPGSKVEIPVTEENGKKIPDGTTFGSDKPGVIDVDKDGKVTVTIPEGSKPGDKITGKITVTYPDGSEEEVPVKVTVTNRDKDDYTPKYNDGSGKPGSKVEIPVTEENGKKIPDGTTFGSDKPGVIDVDKDGKVTVTIPEGSKPGDKITGKITVTYPDGSKEEVPVSVTVTNQDKDDYTPKYKDGNGKPGSKVEIPVTEENGKKIPDGTTFGSDKPGVIDVDKDGKVTVTIPEGSKPGDKITGKITVTYPDGSKEEVPVSVTVTNQDKDDYTPKYKDGNGKPGSKVEIPVTEENGKKIPDGTTFGSDKPGVIDVDKDGKVTVTIPEGSKPGDKITGKITVTYPDGSKEEVPVSVTVTNQDKDDYTPKYKDGNGKPGSKVEIPVTEENGKKIPDGTTFGSDKPGVIDVDKDGKVTVTIPEGSKPGDKITGKITVTYPDGSKEEVPVSVTVTTPARKTPTLDVEQDPKTGDVTVTPKKPDGSTYTPGTKVEIPGKDGNPITVTIGEDGKGKVPNSELPDGKVPGTGKITEPGQPAVEVPVETPAKVTPETPVTEKPVAPVTPDTPVKPDTNGGSGQDTPAPATPTPNAVTPNADQIDTKTTVDNGAKSNDSQNVLPNTGTESNATLASLGLLGLLSGFGLVARKKKED